jgi:hypothetical protein
MRVASNSCKYEYKEGSKGLFLSEHRRCFDEIIQYCNELVYEGALRPLRGKKPEGLSKILPYMGHYDIPQKHSERVGTSRVNKEEAKSIVDWINNNYQELKKQYPEEEKGGDMIGIITPFKAQDAFLVFGSRECLSDDEGRASGLLKKYTPDVIKEDLYAYPELSPHRPHDAIITCGIAATAYKIAVSR